MSILSDMVLVVTAALLVCAAFIDLRHSVIPNGLAVIVGLLFFVYAGFVMQWTVTLGHVGFALVIFLFTLLFYSRGWVGGGDVKLLTVAFLWTGIADAFVFSVLLCICASLHTLVFKLMRLKAGRSRDTDGRTRIPFAPSIATALIGVFVLGFLTRGPIN